MAKPINLKNGANKIVIDELIRMGMYDVELDLTELSAQYDVPKSVLGNAVNRLAKHGIIRKELRGAGLRRLRASLIEPIPSFA